MAQAMTHIQRLMLKIIFLLNAARRNSGEQLPARPGERQLAAESDSKIGC
jgi:hypothetical protein